jgi:hypothetical protein
MFCECNYCEEKEVKMTHKICKYVWGKKTKSASIQFKKGDVLSPFLAVRYGGLELVKEAKEFVRTFKNYVNGNEVNLFIKNTPITELNPAYLMIQFILDLKDEMTEYTFNLLHLGIKEEDVENKDHGNFIIEL